MHTHPTRGWTIWLTGLPGSGKTTIARALQERLGRHDVAAVVLDSDVVRPILAPAAGYAEADREQFYGRLLALAELLTGEGANVIVAATAHRRAYRTAARAALTPFAEIWTRCSQAVCAERDPKGLYAKALAGAVQNLPGFHLPYEAPEAAEAVIDTDLMSVDAGVTHILVAVPFLLRER